MLSEGDLSTLASFILCGGVDVDHTIMPEASRAIIEDLLGEGPFASVANSDTTTKEPLTVAHQFIEENALQEGLRLAKDAAAGKTLAVDPVTIALVTALWILLQTRVDVKLSKTDTGFRWTAHIKKEASGSKAVMDLFNLIKGKLGL